MGEIFRQRIIFSYSIVDAADLTWKLMGFAKDQPMPKCVLFLVPGCGGSAVKHIGPEYDGCLIEVSMMEHGHGCPNLAKCLKNINIPFRIRWTGTAKKYPFHFQIYKPSLGGGFKYLLFSPLFGEDSQFDSYFSKGVKTTNQINPGWQKEKKKHPTSDNKSCVLHCIGNRGKASPSTGDPDFIEWLQPQIWAWFQTNTLEKTCCKTGWFFQGWLSGDGLFEGW